MTIYLDHNATSPPTVEHLKKLFDILNEERPANPSSPHALGRAASVLLSQARKHLANALHVDVAEIIFTSGGTEANNLGTRGVLAKKLGDMDTTSSVSVITTAFEHSAVKKTLEQIAQFFPNRIELIVIQPNEAGYISAKDVISNIKPNTALISIIAANNEIGTVQPIKEIGDFLNEKRWGKPQDDTHDLFASLHSKVTTKNLQDLHFHVDAVQIFGKIQAEKWISQGYDSIALSGHKLGALQGIGALALRRGRTFFPLTTGGAQEKNRRAGTENIPGIISFGMICESMRKKEYWDKIDSMQNLTHFLYDELTKNPRFVLNSQKTHALPNTIHFSLREADCSGEDLILKLDMQGICVSSGSACSSGVNLPSHVVLAIGKNKQLASNSLRISLGVETTLADIHKLLNFLLS